MFIERDYISKEEIEEKGYTYIEEKRKLKADYVNLRKFNSNPMNIERTGYYHMKKPLIDIGPNETVYYEDLHE